MDFLGRDFLVAARLLQVSLLTEDDKPFRAKSGWSAFD